jgi:stress-induced-phosphoprotein 1
VAKRDSLFLNLITTVVALTALILIGTSRGSARSNLVAQGRAAIRAHDCDSAIKYFSQAIAQDPSNISLYEARGKCYLSDKQKKYDLALADFDAIIRLDP